MDLHVKALAGVAAVLVIFTGGYLLKGTIEEAEQADLLRQQIKTQVERQDVLADRARKAEDELAQIRAASANLNRKWNAIRAEEPDACQLDYRRIGLLRDATGPLGDTPR